jgi:hypothetical protein
MTESALPALPPVEVKKHKPTEVMDYATAYGRQCYEAGVAAERARCTKLCSDVWNELKLPAALGAEKCLDAIRAE